jgi:hypothetical protein
MLLTIGTFLPAASKAKGKLGSRLEILSWQPLSHGIHTATCKSELKAGGIVYR